jgi:predicted SnoaL-like aldol condensation-catalyzing enzyme
MTGTHTDADRNRENYLKAKDAFNAGDLDACMAFYAPNHQIRSRDVPSGREQIRAFLAGMSDTWGGLQVVVERTVAEGDWVMGLCRSVAVHDKEFMGVPATGRDVTAAFWDLHRFDESGLIAETWNLSDSLSIMQQLGLINSRR